MGGLYMENEHMGLLGNGDTLSVYLNRETLFVS